MTETQAELKRYQRVLQITILIFVVEIFGALISKSMTLLADSFHVFIDSGSICVSLVVARAVQTGYHEKAVRSIGGKINATLLVAIGLWMIFETISQMRHHQVATELMIFFAVITGAGNIWQHRALNNGNHCQHITHKTLNAHVVTDFLQSVGVVTTGIAIYITSQPMIDIYVSLILACYIIIVGINLFIQASDSLLT